jgi:hypothetical protein
MPPTDSTVVPLLAVLPSNSVWPPGPKHFLKTLTPYRRDGRKTNCWKGVLNRGGPDVCSRLKFNKETELIENSFRSLRVYEVARMITSPLLWSTSHCYRNYPVHASSLSRLQIFFPITACIFCFMLLQECAFWYDIELWTAWFKVLSSRDIRSSGMLLPLSGSYRRFGTACRSRLQRWSTLWLLDRWKWASMMSRNVGNYQKSLRGIPEERISHTVPEDWSHAYGLYIHIQIEWVNSTVDGD